ncbi:MAG TPA: IPT/TIG domain-containing protein, partial [Acidimicrobiia bacterium]|nr:IPT/TIG domain-containing protein [Acidimicrobiia bacterium]
QFTFVAAPTVTGLDPSSGPTTGGTSVRITGSGFTGATAVAFGDVAVAFTVDSDTSITATSAGTTDPPGDAVDVTVTTPGGTSAKSLADRFTYTATAPGIVVAPSSGPSRTRVVVSGDNFQPGELVRVTYLTGLTAPHPRTVALCHATADAIGSFTCHGRIPGLAAAGALGDHAIIATGALSASTATATFTRT